MDTGTKVGEQFTSLDTAAALFRKMDASRFAVVDTAVPQGRLRHGPLNRDAGERGTGDVALLQESFAPSDHNGVVLALMDARPTLKSKAA